VSQPEPGDLRLPILFLDRSVGRVGVAAGLRAVGIEVITLAEHYGMPADERVSDVEWLMEAGRNGWAALKSDANIRRRDAPERRALVEAQVRTFVISGQLTTTAKIERVVANLDRIARVCQNPGPFVYRIHPEHLQRLQLPR
jgi:hypothetical protein